MQSPALNENANPTLSKTAAVLLLLACAAGCSSSSSTTGDAGPNDAKSSTGGSGGGGGSGGAGGAGAANTAGAVNLRTAGNYVILAESGISTVPPAVVTGDLGISPMGASSITNFSLIADATNVFSTSGQVTGKLYAADYTAPTPATLIFTAIGDMGLAFTDAAGRAPSVTELGAGSIGGMTLAPGVYKWGTGLLIPTDLTLNGSATAVWILQIAQNLTVSSAVSVHLTGGALAKNVFWQVAGSVDVGTTSHLEGIVLWSWTDDQPANGRGSITGRLMAARRRSPSSANTGHAAGAVGPAAAVCSAQRRRRPKLAASSGSCSMRPGHDLPVAIPRSRSCPASARSLSFGSWLFP